MSVGACENLPAPKVAPGNSNDAAVPPNLRSGVAVLSIECIIKRAEVIGDVALPALGLTSF